MTELDLSRAEQSLYQIFVAGYLENEVGIRRTDPDTRRAMDASWQAYQSLHMPDLPSDKELKQAQGMLKQLEEVAYEDTGTVPDWIQTAQQSVWLLRADLPAAHPEVDTHD